MKKSIFLFILMYSSVSTAQFVVSDTGSYTYLAQEIANSSETLKTTSKQLELAAKQAKRIETVNSYLKQSKLVLAIADNFTDSFEAIGQAPKFLKYIRLDEVRTGLIENGKELVNHIEIMVSLYSSLKSDKLLAMDDGDRTTLLLDLYEKSRETKSEARRYISKIKRLSQN